MSNSLIYAHRGASGCRFENTISAFEEAVRQGADGIELDVQLTADGQLVVIHDLNLKRLAGLDLPITSLTTVDLQTVKVGKPFRRYTFGHRIPLLYDAARFCREYGMALNIELKESVYSNREAIERIIQCADLVPNVHISSFDYETLLIVKEIDPDMETALLLKRKQVNWDQLADYHVDAFHFHKRLWKPPFREQLKGSGKLLRMYGVTGAEPFIRSAAEEIDGWITDYPKRLGKVIKGSR